MEIVPGWVPAAFFGIAFLYSLVGFGGGSSYVAILVIAGLSYQTVPPLALACNLVVAGTGFMNFARDGHFRPDLVLPFVILSVPLAYLGGRMPVGREIFALLLGASLFAAGVRMLLAERDLDRPVSVSRGRSYAVGLPVGGFFGFISGLVGIGGGVFLSPFLLLLKWANARQAACAASFFITLNSIAGLAGHWQKNTAADLGGLGILAAAVFMGGQAGSRMGSRHVAKPVLTRILAGLVLFVSAKLLLRGL
jgi:uncharacterized membrane protein YfcA